MRWLVVAAALGLGFSASSAWVHYRILQDPFYSSVCDVNATFSCAEAYTSAYGSVAGVPVALIGTLYFAFILGLIALCRSSAAARHNVTGYVFVLSTLGLAAVLYYAYVSAFVLQTVCLLCVGTYVSILALFFISGAATKHPIRSVGRRAAQDVGMLVRTPAALTAVAGFAVAAFAAVVLFPGDPVSASAAAPATAASDTAQPSAQTSPLQQLEAYLAQAPRVTVDVSDAGAAVVIVKFNDYQCPPCGQTFHEYKPVLARLQQQHPGQIAYITKDFPLDMECNPMGGSHAAACEAAVAVRLARERGRGNAMEDWLFANQPALTPDLVRTGVRMVGGVADFEARYAATLNEVRQDINQGVQLGVRGTPTFYMNGLQLPALRPEMFEAAVTWELRRVASGR